MENTKTAALIAMNETISAMRTDMATMHVADPALIRLADAYAQALRDYHRVTAWGAEDLRGLQVIYAPPHAGYQLDHPHNEAGFITSTRGVYAWVRFWFWARPGHMRTRSCSERVEIARLIPHETVDQRIVDRCVALIENGEPIPDETMEV